LDIAYLYLQKQKIACSTHRNREIHTTSECNVDAMPEFLSFFLSEYIVQGHLDLVKTANIRDVDNETDFCKDL